VHLTLHFTNNLETTPGRTFAIALFPDLCPDDLRQQRFSKLTNFRVFSDGGRDRQLPLLIKTCFPSFSMRAAPPIASRALGARPARLSRSPCVRLISNNPEKMSALKEMGLDVVERIALDIPTTDAARDYMRKRERMGHLL
jgi:hypothetical protein